MIRCNAAFERIMFERLERQWKKEQKGSRERWERKGHKNSPSEKKFPPSAPHPEEESELVPPPQGLFGDGGNSGDKNSSGPYLSRH